MNFGRVAATCCATNNPVAGFTQLNSSFVVSRDRHNARDYVICNWMAPSGPQHQLLLRFWRVLSQSHNPLMGEFFDNRDAIGHYVFDWCPHPFLSIIIHRARQGSALRGSVVVVRHTALHLRRASLSRNKDVVSAKEIIECDPRGVGRTLPELFTTAQMFVFLPRTGQQQCISH